MAGAIKYNGDDLLQVFAELNIHLGNLVPNDVRAWFDTDDQSKIDFLNFICSSITRENVLTAQELEEFEAIENPLHGSDLELAINMIEEERPGIFDVELNSQEVKLLQVEFQQLKQEETTIDQLLKVNEHLHKSLSQEKSILEIENEGLKFTVEEKAKECIELARNLDEQSSDLYIKLTNNLMQLSNFQYNESDFFNQMNLEDIQDTEEFLESIKNFVKQKYEDLSGTFTESKIILNSTPNDESSEDTLDALKNKVFSSYIEFFKAAIEQESLRVTLNYLEKFFVSNYFAGCTVNSVSEEMLESKQGKKDILFSFLEKKAMSISEELILQTNIKKSRKELSSLEDTFLCFSQIAEYCSKVLCVSSCALMLLLQEKKSIEDSHRFIKKISRYILHTPEDSKQRTEIMSSMIENYSSFKEKPIECRNQITLNIMNLLQAGILKEAFLFHSHLEKNLRDYERNNFRNNVELTEIIENLFKNDVVKKFLISGPTNQLVTIPHKIQKSLKNIQSNLEKQNSIIKLLLQTVSHSSKKLSSDAWLKNLRLVWIYFLVAPKKLEELSIQMAEELKNRETNAIRFKDV